MENNIIYSELLSQTSYLRLSKRLIAVFGLEMAVFLSFLIDKYEYYRNNDLLEENSFYATNDDILVFTGLKANKIQSLKEAGERLELFYIEKKGNPKKSYYFINFNKINEVFLENKSIEDLSYKRIFNEELDVKNLNYDFLKNLSKKELRILCKKEKITYVGKNLKEDLINKILEKVEVKIKKEANKKVEKAVPNFFGHKYSKNLGTSVQKILNKQEQNKKTNKEKQKQHLLDEFKEIFKEFKINFTKKNQNSILNLLNVLTVTELKENLYKAFEIIKNDEKIINKAAFFTEILSNENFINFTKKEKNIELDENKKKWLNRYTAVVTNKILKEEIENIIKDISFEELEKNKSKLSMLSTFEFKKYLFELKRKNL